MSADGSSPSLLLVTLAFFLSIAIFAAPIWADFEAGMDAYGRGDYATALREWRPLAERGHPGAQYNLGMLYDFKKGVPQDFAVARQWYDIAAHSTDDTCRNVAAENRDKIADGMTSAQIAEAKKR